MAPRPPRSLGRRLIPRSVLFLVLFLLSCAVFRVPLTVLLKASLFDDRYSHVFFIFLISAGLIYFRRASVFGGGGYCLWGAPLLLLGLALGRLLQNPESFSDQNDYLSYSVSATLLTLVAAFLLCYGVSPLRAARFPLCFLVLMIPMPAVLLTPTVGALQQGSADATRVLFRIFAVPAHWEGLVFSLRDYHFEIATECSGIRSCLILFVASILAGHLFLRSMWAKVCFSLCTIFAAIFKNGVRIATVSYLTTYVDKAYYTSWVHRSGGAPFSLLVLAILVPFLIALRKAEIYQGRIDGDKSKA